MKDEELTADTLFDGRLQCFQRRSGYRFSVDAVLLAHFMTFPPAALVLELGAGNGVVSLIMAYRSPGLLITSLEIQTSLFSLLEKNIAINSFQNNIKPVRGDLLEIKANFGAGSFEYVVSNPPYRKLTTGRRSDGQEQAQARHEISANITDVVRAALYVLKVGGRAAFVYPAARGAAIISELKNNGLEPKRLQIVYSYPGSAGKLLLVEAIKGGGEGLEIMPPFFIYQTPGGKYTDRMAALYRP